MHMDLSAILAYIEGKDIVQYHPCLGFIQNWYLRRRRIDLGPS